MNITINNRTWNVIEVNPGSGYLQRSDNVYTLGVTDDSTSCIYINSKLNDELRTKVISHEIVHAVCFSYGITVPIDTEELIADFVATYGREVIEIADIVISKLSFHKNFVVT